MNYTRRSLLKERIPKNAVAKFFLGIFAFVKIIFDAAFFAFVLFVLLSFKVVSFIVGRMFFLKKIGEKIEKLGNFIAKKIYHFFSKSYEGNIDEVDLIRLSMKNLAVKKTRTVVTVGGMMIGIGSIVFLVSLGYGVQKLVISRVAKLDEIKQADVVLQTGRKIKITDQTLNDFSNVQHVQEALPLIQAVGNVSYSNSHSDMAVYAVQSEYLNKSAIKPTSGKIFENNDVSVKLAKSFEESEVASNYENKAEDGDEIGKVKFEIDEGQWVKVRLESNVGSSVVGYTRKNGEDQTGTEIWGGTYADNENGQAGTGENGEKYGKWISATVLLWEKKNCNVKSDQGCEEGKYLPMMVNGKQVPQAGYFAEIGISHVGVADDEESEKAEGDLSAHHDAVTGVELPKTATRQAVVNQAVLKVLGLSEAEAVGKSFALKFVLSGEQLSIDDQKVESAPADYVIVGVIPDNSVPIVYVPFLDLRSLWVSNYSQVKLVVDNEMNLPMVRRQVEAMGYNTHSVVDTVNQINSFFTTVRLVLGLFGFIALTVAALGMFNTLTVSLLERTREVGLLKALGMRSAEVRKLFLTESMTMGFLGGLLGILFGFLAGKLVSLLLSVFAFTKGMGVIDVAFIPFSFIFIIIVLSVLTGILTGIYPARRATKISALNALRYE